MKKHPIDDLFSRKLRDAEITPREEAYLRLQERMNTKQRRIGGWWQQGPWLAAAGVCLFLGIGWVIWTNNHFEPVTTAQVTSKKQLIISQKLDQIAQTPPNNTNLGTNTESKPRQTAKIQKIETTNGNLKQFEIKTIAQKQVAEATPTAMTEPQSTIVKEESKIIAQIESPATEEKSHVKTVVLQLPDFRAIVATENINETTKNSADASNSTTAEDLLSKPRKSSRMAKVWKQLKNAKNGEKVDWEEVGINPKLLAKATGKQP